MIRTKFLLLLSGFVLLTGCAATPCGLPGHPNYSGKVCNYKLLITDKDENTKMVSGTVPQSVLDANKASGKDKDDSRNYSNYPSHLFRVYVGDDVKQVKINVEQHFHKMDNDMSYGLKLGKGNLK